LFSVRANALRSVGATGVPHAQHDHGALRFAPEILKVACERFVSEGHVRFFADKELTVRARAQRLPASVTYCELRN
jgi:hypothetical protein